MNSASYLILLSCQLCSIHVQSLSASSTVPARQPLPSPSVLHNLNAIVSHIQNPSLYSAEWANRIEFNEHALPVANSAVKEGDIVSLFPIESISTRSHVGEIKLEEDCKNSINKSTSMNNKHSSNKSNNNSNSKHIDNSNSNADRLSKRVTLWQKERYPYPHLRAPSDNTSTEESSLYIHSRMERSDSPGWYGNMIPMHTATKTTSTNNGKEGNCAFVPLPGVAPLCAFVATRSIAKGEAIQEIPNSMETHDHEPGINQNQPLVDMHVATSVPVSVSASVAKQYANEIGDLMPYLEMAYAHTVTTPPKQNNPTFHPIRTSYPNIQQIHTDPDIYTIPDFLTPEECDKVITKSRHNMQTCLVKNADTGAVEADPSRTSTNANIPQQEVPSIIQKLLSLINCKKEQLETLQVLNYQQGQQFQPHTDGFVGPTNACGFLDSGRIATIFCYLNDVQEGGTTLFTKLGLEIKPVKGMAVVHFPMSLGLAEDERTEHQGSVAVDEKWILTTWVWKHWKGDYRYDDDKLPTMSNDII